MYVTINEIKIYKLLKHYSIQPILQEWSGFVNWMHTELSESKEKNILLEKQLAQAQETVCELQEAIELQKVCYNDQ